MKQESFEPEGSFFVLDENVKLGHGDCLDLLKQLPDNSVDSIVTDPPYGLKFMGKKWDYDVPTEQIWAECLRVLKPGGHLLAFASARTQHRMAVRIEDAGFEIRDMIAWVYGSGFPKSYNLKGDWEGWGTALKPALEPVTVARKPFKGTVAANVLANSTGAINIDGCRVEVTPEDAEITINRKGYKDGINHVSKPREDGETWQGWGMKSKKQSTLAHVHTGRWPANLIHDGSDEVLAGFQHTKSVGGNGNRRAHGPAHGDNTYGNYKAKNTINGIAPDQGSAARFFYCAKASKKDRGLDNKHPTVKPTELMRYLCRLVTPPGGTVLDPFMGSGSTGKAAILEGFDFIGIEREAEYFEIAKQRVFCI